MVQATLDVLDPAKAKKTYQSAKAELRVTRAPATGGLPDCKVSELDSNLINTLLSHLVNWIPGSTSTAITVVATARDQNGQQLKKGCVVWSPGHNSELFYIVLLIQPRSDGLLALAVPLLCHGKDSQAQLSMDAPLTLAHLPCQLGPCKLSLYARCCLLCITPLTCVCLGLRSQATYLNSAHCLRANVGDVKLDKNGYIMPPPLGQVH